MTGKLNQPQLVEGRKAKRAAERKKAARNHSMGRLIGRLERANEKQRKAAARRLETVTDLGGKVERKPSAARRLLKKAIGKASSLASRLQTAVEVYRHHFQLRFYRTGSGLFRLQLGTKVDQVGLATLSCEEAGAALPSRVVLDSDYGMLPSAVVRALIAVTGMLPLRGKSLVPWQGTWLEAMFPTFKDAVGYLASMYSAIQASSFYKDVEVWTGVLTGRDLEVLGCDGAGWRIVYDGPTSWPWQVRALLKGNVLAMAKGELFPVRWQHLPEVYREEIERRMVLGLPLPFAIIDREQWKAGGRVTTLPEKRGELKAEYASGSAYIQDAIDKLDGILSLRCNVGVMNVHDTKRTMKLGPQIVLRCGWAPDFIQKAISITEANWTRFFGEDGEGIDKIYNAVISGDESGEMARVAAVSKALGLDPKLNELLAVQAAGRLHKKFYRSIVGMGMEAQRGALWIHDHILIPHNVIIAPVSLFKSGKLIHGQEVVFGRYPIVSPQSGASVYIVWDPRELPEDLVDACPWLAYNEAIVGRKSGIMLDVAGDDDGDIGFIVTDPQFVEMMRKPPHLIGADALWDKFREEYPEDWNNLMREFLNHGQKVGHMPKERMFVEGYTVNKKRAKAPAKDHLADLAKDHTGPIGIFTKAQDAFLRLMAKPGLDPRSRTKLMLAAMAMAFMAQCAVDSKKNTIPVYRWWLLLDIRYWTIGVKDGVPALCPAEAFTGNGKDILGEIVDVDEVDGFGFNMRLSKNGKPYKAYRNAGDAPWDEGHILDIESKMRPSAAFGWVAQLCKEIGFPLDERKEAPPVLEQLLPWDVQKSMPAAHLKGTESMLSTEQLWHPIDHVFNHVVGTLIPSENFPKFLLDEKGPECEDLIARFAKLGIEVDGKKFSKQMAVSSLAKLLPEYNKSAKKKLDAIPADLLLNGTLPNSLGSWLLRRTKFDAVVSAISAKVKWLKDNEVNEGTRDFVKMLDGAISASKRVSAPEIAKLEFGQLMALVRLVSVRFGPKAAWSMVCLGHNAFLEALSIPAEPVCNHLSSNWEAFEAKVEQTAAHLDNPFQAIAMVLAGNEIGEDDLVAKANTFAATHPDTVILAEEDSEKVITKLHKCEHCCSYARSRVTSKRTRLPDWAVESAKGILSEANAALKSPSVQEAIRGELDALGLLPKEEEY